MDYTDNYKLRLPDRDDYYNVEDFNYNANSIDGILKAADDRINGKSDQKHIHSIDDVTGLGDVLAGFSKEYFITSGFSVLFEKVEDSEFGNVANITVKISRKDIALNNGCRLCVFIKNLEIKDFPLNRNGYSHYVIIDGVSYVCSTNSNVILENDCVLTFVYVNGYFYLSV